MKLFLFLFWTISIIANNIYSQTNLINNPGFEKGKTGHVPRCNYGIEPGHNTSEAIETDILNWEIASCHVCDFAFGTPDWMDDFCLNSVIYSGSRFIYLQRGNDQQPKHNNDAIRTGLISFMKANKSYVFKIMFTSVPRKYGFGSGFEDPTIRIFLTKYGLNWSRSWGNVKLSWPMYPPYYILNGWSERAILIPSIAEEFFPKLGNIVLAAEQAQCYINSVELVELCENPLLLENHNFNEGQDELPFKSSGSLLAGYDVGNPSDNGNVLVKNGANCTFKAGLEVVLNPGFEVEEKGNFIAFIQSCDKTTVNRIAQDSSMVISIFDDSRDTLNCNSDSLIIEGLDGDTSGYSFSWDFGNGMTSSGGIGRTYYDSPGEYLVKMILTDSIGTDTLSKIYIIPNCLNRLSKRLILNNQITIYPNPNYGELLINASQIDSKIENIQITDISGRTVIIISGNQIKDKIIKIDLRNLENGIYTLKLYSNGSFINKSIILLQ